MGLDEPLPSISQTVTGGASQTPMGSTISRSSGNISSGSMPRFMWSPWSPEPSIQPDESYSSSIPGLSTDHPDHVQCNGPSSPPLPPVKTWQTSVALQIWHHLAAVKAIAFCPWRPHLLATGGGSNDKMIHFFHTTSGAALATISVSAQVTSLVWSTTRREIAATFGYAQPDHAIRIAVFSWPDCQMVGNVKWDGEHRALFSVLYPGGPAPISLPIAFDVKNCGVRAGGPTADTTPGESSTAAGTTDSQVRRKKEREGCLIVAASDKSVKFHEIWGTGRSNFTTASAPGVLGGSDILEMAEGIDKEGDVIR